MSQEKQRTQPEIQPEELDADLLRLDTDYDVILKKEKEERLEEKQ